MRLAVVAVLLVAALTPTAATAQTASDELGTWLIYNGTFRFTDRWTVFTEAQLRLYELASNPQEAFVRIAGQYDFTPQAMVGARAPETQFSAVA